MEKKNLIFVMKSTPEARMDFGLQKAIIQYQHAIQMPLKHDDFLEKGPFLVAENVEPLAFEGWYLKQLQKWKLFYDKTKKEIWLYGDPTLPHERTASWLSSEIRLALYKLGEDMASDSINPDGSTQQHIPAGAKEPDFSFTAVGASNGPSVVGEIAYGNESLKKLKEEQKMWCESSHTQFFIGIKIVDTASHHHRDPKCVLITWDRDHKKLHQVDFGYRTKCDSLDKMWLEIPIKHLYHGSQIPSSLGNHKNVKIDLFKIREKIKSAVITYRNES